LRLLRLLRASGPWKMDEHNLEIILEIYQNGRQWAKTR